MNSYSATDHWPCNVRVYLLWGKEAKIMDVFVWKLMHIKICTNPNIMPQKQTDAKLLF